MNSWSPAFNSCICLEKATDTALCGVHGQILHQNSFLTGNTRTSIKRPAVRRLKMPDEALNKLVKLANQRYSLAIVSGLYRTLRNENSFSFICGDPLLGVRANQKLLQPRIAWPTSGRHARSIHSRSELVGVLDSHEAS